MLGVPYTSNDTDSGTGRTLVVVVQFQVVPLVRWRRRQQPVKMYREGRWTLKGVWGYVVGNVDCGRTGGDREIPIIVHQQTAVVT